MPHNSCPLARPFLTPPRPLATYERGRDLCSFVSAAASHIMRTLQRPCRSRPSKRKVNHRRFLQNQICRSFVDIEAATHHLASSILSQEASTPPEAAQQKAPPKPRAVLMPPAISSFSGIAEAFVAPDPNPSCALPLDALAPDADELFEPITGEMGLATADSWETLNLPPSEGSSFVGWAAPPHTSQHHVGATPYTEPNTCSLVEAQSLSPALEEGAFVISGQDAYGPLWDLEMW